MASGSLVFLSTLKPPSALTWLVKIVSIENHFNQSRDSNILLMWISTYSCIQTICKFQCKSLTHLHMNSNISDASVFALTTCTNLAFLELRCNKQTDTTFQYLKVVVLRNAYWFLSVYYFLKIMHNLRHLHLENVNNATTLGIQSLFDLSNENSTICQLKHFRIANSNAFDDNCIDAFTKWLAMIQSIH